MRITRTVIHQLGKWRGGRQICVLCGRVMKTAFEDEVGIGPAEWPPPMEEGAAFECDIYDDGSVHLSSAGARVTGGEPNLCDGN